MKLFIVIDTIPFPSSLTAIALNFTVYSNTGSILTLTGS